jgi:chorismate dehydratase
VVSGCEDKPGRRVRIGAVSYLNSKPLIHGFGGLSSCAELVLDVPSRLADQLAAGELDVALVPSIECLEWGYRVVSDACIACRGPVLSVRLLSRVPLHRVATVAADAGSRTSVVLMQILFQQRFGRLPQLHVLPLEADWQDAAADAVLLIGDRAIHARQADAGDAWDLGAEWCRAMGVPFVFAMWGARPGVSVAGLDDLLGGLRDGGVAHLEAIATEEAPRVGLARGVCLSYLRDNLHFTLGPAEREGLELFARFAAALRAPRLPRHEETRRLSVS